MLLFRSLIRKSKFLLMVLDGARYDTFNAIYAKYLRGRLYAARVPPPHTYGWLPRAFSSPEFNNVRVFYARLMIRSHNIMIDRLVPKGRNLELISIRPRKMRELGTVLPSEVNEEVFMVGLSGRDIIWYLQPHFPWIYDLKLSKTLMREVLLHDFVPPDIVANKLKKLDVSRKRLVNIYHGNLILALKYVSDLLNYVKDLGIKYDAMVVTSDHGELLGEYGLYMHPHYELPQLCIVPWLEVEDRV
ncbi:MAG: hypothetical protein N3H31_06440 [Candidatus Nezhaarchaeota archaeon]|nr:hypothetical protein [Candidatus Nezhaarchaeota archaeon]